MSYPYNNAFKNNGETNFARGDHAVGKQVNIIGRQVPVDELLSLLGQVQQDLTRLPLSESVRDKVKGDIRTAQREARKKEPDKGEVVATLKAVQEVLKAVPGTVAAALSVGELLGRALIWCDKAGWM
jgi:hypothetical protein